MALPPLLDEVNLYKFRTKICERYVKQGKCEFADRCQYSHDLRWTRRPPWKYTYSPELCRDLVFVTDGRGRTIAKSNCKQKRNCRFSHTKEEQMYHPHVYKTMMCRQYKDNGWCERYYCPFAHNESELRHIDPSLDIQKIVLTARDQDELCPEIYLPSDRPHPRLRTRFMAIMDGFLTNNQTQLNPANLHIPVGMRSRQPYTDFISSHTPQSVLSDSCSSHAYSKVTSVNIGGTTVEILPAGDGTCPPITNNTAAQRSRDRANGNSVINGPVNPPPCASACNNQRRSRRMQQYETPKQEHGLTLSELKPPRGCISAHLNAINSRFTGEAKIRRHSPQVSDQPKQPDRMFQGQPESRLEMISERSSAAPIQPIVTTNSGNRSDDPSGAQDLLYTSQMDNLSARLGNASGSFTVKCLSGDICYWSEPIGRSRDDPSVLVYAGLVLGEGNTREVVAIKQLPVVVNNRAGALWAEIQRYLCLNDPRLVNIKRTLFLPGDGDEGTSLWVVMEKCDGTLPSALRTTSNPEQFLQAAFPSTGLIGLMRHILQAIHTLHYQSRAPHLRIHPGNVMIGCHGEIKIGDCAGKIRYLSILDLLYAGRQGAINSHALLQWILGAPQETCWMAPEFLSSLVSLEQHLSNILQNDADESAVVADHAFAALAKSYAWPFEFLRRADCWSLGATLFHFATGGLHPYGDTGDPELIPRIIGDRKVNFDKVETSLWLSDILKGLLHPDPEKRLTIPQALCHPMFWDSADIELYLEAFRAATVRAVDSGKSAYVDIWCCGMQRLRQTPLDSTQPISVIRCISPCIQESEGREAGRILQMLSYCTNWVDSLSALSSNYPILSLLISYMAMPSAPRQLLAANHFQTACSLLLFLAYVSADSNIPLFDRRAIISECLSIHGSTLLHSVYVFLFPKVPPPHRFVLSQTQSPLAALLLQSESWIASDTAFAKPTLRMPEDSSITATPNKLANACVSHPSGSLLCCNVERRKSEQDTGRSQLRHQDSVSHLSQLSGALPSTSWNCDLRFASTLPDVNVLTEVASHRPLILGDPPEKCDAAWQAANMMVEQRLLKNVQAVQDLTQWQRLLPGPDDQRRPLREINTYISGQLLAYASTHCSVNDLIPRVRAMISAATDDSQLPSRGTDSKVPNASSRVDSFKGDPDCSSPGSALRPSLEVSSSERTIPSGEAKHAVDRPKGKAARDNQRNSIQSGRQRQRSFTTTLLPGTRTTVKPAMYSRNVGDGSMEINHTVNLLSKGETNYSVSAGECEQVVVGSVEVAPQQNNKSENYRIASSTDLWDIKACCNNSNKQGGSAVVGSVYEVASTKVNANLEECPTARPRISETRRIESKTGITDLATHAGCTIQMPVAVSTVSTALSSATAGEVGPSHSQTTDALGEVSAWNDFTGAGLGSQKGDVQIPQKIQPGAHKEMKREYTGDETQGRRNEGWGRIEGGAKRNEGLSDNDALNICSVQ